MNQFLLGVILFAVAACATPGLEPNRSEAVPTSAAVQAEESDGVMVANDPAAKNPNTIEDQEAPNASEIPAEMIPGRSVPEPAIVCERVVPTGSVLSVEVCRNRADIERKQEADQKIFDDIKRNSAIGISRL